MNRPGARVWSAVIVHNEDATGESAAALFGVAVPDVPAGCTLYGWTWEENLGDRYGIVRIVHPGTSLPYSVRKHRPDRMRPVFIQEAADHG